MNIDPVRDHSYDIMESSHTTQGKCPACGGYVCFMPEEGKLVCEYCGLRQELALEGVEVHENDYEQYLNDVSLSEQNKESISEVTCGQCGARTTFPPDITSFSCAFCGTPIVINNAATERSWKPEYMLPFKVGKSKCKSLFLKWVASRWFLPSDFSKKHNADERLKGIYLPYWTYDADTVTHYSGERGINRTVTRRINGRLEYHTVTDWYPVSGTVSHFFDDVLIPASDSLPNDISLSLLNWDRKNYVPYNNQFVFGFLTELYKHDFKDCFKKAQKRMDSYISSLVRADIGGNAQRVHYKNTNYSNVTFKHVLLPVWISAYRYNNKVFIFAINGRTGQVVGQRPWSVLKISLLIIAILVVLIALFALNG